MNYLDKIKRFENEDDLYLQCVERNWGWVLTEQDGGGYMLHTSDCSHLQQLPGDQLTAKPRRWAELDKYLIQLAKDESGSAPPQCRDCL